MKACRGIGVGAATLKLNIWGGWV